MWMSKYSAVLTLVNNYQRTREGSFLFSYPLSLYNPQHTIYNTNKKLDPFVSRKKAHFFKLFRLILKKNNAV